MTEPRSPFPWWVLLGGLVLAAGYLPTLAAPFDFVDDGNLVYPAPSGTTAAGYVGRWWDKVAANVDHLGPFRPTLWVHWELAANSLGADPAAWRTLRLAWCGLAGMALLWLMRELKLHPAAALLAGAAAMWNPYRNEIWTSLTLAEGVAMPYALAALAAARRAAQSGPLPPGAVWGTRPAVGQPAGGSEDRSRSERATLSAWDAVAVLCLLVCLGCKNTFAALVPALLALRLLPDGATLADGWRRGRWAAAAYLAPLAMPAAHFVYFKLHWHPGQYETPGPSVAQAVRLLLWLKGAAGLDFLGAGLALVLGVLAWARLRSLGTTVPGVWRQYRAAVVCGILLLAAGFAVYLPLPMTAPRYTMPAVWGWDVLFALVLTAFCALPLTWPKRVAWVGVAAGLAAIAVGNVGRQEKVMARSRMLWDALEHVERTAPADARLAWTAGDPEAGGLGVEEGIHFGWHLAHRGRPDVRVGLYDVSGNVVPRVELPAPDGPPHLRLAGPGPAAPGWRAGAEFAAGYRLGKKRFACRLDVPPPAPPTLYADPFAAEFLRAAFDNPGAADADLLRRLQKPAAPGRSPTALLTGSDPPAVPR